MNNQISVYHGLPIVVDHNLPILPRPKISVSTHIDLPTDFRQKIDAWFIEMFGMTERVDMLMVGPPVFPNKIALVSQEAFNALRTVDNH